MNGEIVPLATYNVDWNISANSSSYGSSQLNMSKGASSSSTPSLTGTITVPSTGLYSFAIGNTTDTRINATGSFTY